MSYEQRRHLAPWVQQLQARTEGPLRVQLSPEVGVDFPVEVFDEHGPGYVSAGSLGLSAELERDLAAWLQWWQDHVEVTGDEVVGGDEEQWHRWSEDGVRLLGRLRDELGPGFRVRSV